MDSSVRLGYVIIYVEDVEATVAFYREAFGVGVRFVHESGQYAEMVTGETTLAFAEEAFVQEGHAFRPNRRGEAAAGAEMAFVVDDVEGAFSRAVKAGATVVTELEEKPWGQVVSYVRDNNGFLVEICSAVGG